jgi:ferredoxin-NADP reductase
LKAVLESWRDLARGVRHFEFAVPELARFNYAPGQFISVQAPVAGKLITRAYSIASAPRGNRFELCLNLVEEGRLSPVMFALRKADAVEFTGPLGYFVWKQPLADSLLVATGTGVAPLRAMLPQALEAHPERQFTLIFGTRTPEQILYADEFAALSARHPNFRYWPVLSRASAAWAGRRGHVQEHIDEALGSRRDGDVYVCGLRAMVDDVRTRLKEMGFERKQLVTERYD